MLLTRLAGIVQLIVHHTIITRARLTPLVSVQPTKERTVGYRVDRLGSSLNPFYHNCQANPAKREKINSDHDHRSYTSLWTQLHAACRTMEAETRTLKAALGQCAYHIGTHRGD